MRLRSSIRIVDPSSPPTSAPPPPSTHTHTHTHFWDQKELRFWFRYRLLRVWRSVFVFIVSVFVFVTDILSSVAKTVELWKAQKTTPHQSARQRCSLACVYTDQWPQQNSQSITKATTDVKVLGRFPFVWSGKSKKTGSGQFKWKDLKRVRTFFPQLKLYRPLLCPAEIEGKSVTDHQQDT